MSNTSCSCVHSMGRHRIADISVDTKYSIYTCMECPCWFIVNIKEFITSILGV